jgi:hypothetical protein
MRGVATILTDANKGIEVRALLSPPNASKESAISNALTEGFLATDE